MSKKYKAPKKKSAVGKQIDEALEYAEGSPSMSRREHVKSLEKSIKKARKDTGFYGHMTVPSNKKAFPSSPIKGGINGPC